MLDLKTNIKNINLSKIIPKNKYILAGIILVIFFSTIFGGLGFYFKDRIFPGVKVLGFRLGGKKVSEASLFLSQKINAPDKLEFTSNEKGFELSLKEISLTYDYDKTAKEAYEVYRNGSCLKNFIGRITSLFRTHNISLYYSLNNDKLDEYLQVVSEQVLSEPYYPSVKIEGDILSVYKGAPGEILDKNTLLLQFNKKILNANYSKISLPLKKVDPSLTDEESTIFKERSRKLLGKTFSLKNEYDSYTFDEQTILSFLDFHEQYSIQKIQDFITEEIVPKIERPSQNATLHFEGGKVTEFVPAKDGLSIEVNKLLEEIINNLATLENSENKSFSIDIPVIKATPEITLNEVNNLGIKELLGRGSSKFRGSIPGRAHNISLAASKFNGVLVAPGEIFSFNNTLGDVSTFTGYKQAYIIKDGRTVLGDGGGVCQVSTTLFRAILNAGLPVNERRAHSYRVSYYEQDSSPGLDATVFDPSTDLKFTNDTPGHLLIQTQFDATSYSLVFEIYGTFDGRIASISKPITTASIAPPDDLYIDDPSLPGGTIKQIDYKAWGAKVVFDYLVERNGEKLIEEKFISNYRPWQAVFLRGTGPTI